MPARVAASMARDLNPGQLRANVIVTYGGTGSVASYKGQELASTPVRTGVGTLTFTFGRPFVALIGTYGKVHNATGTAVLFPVRTSWTGGVATIETRLAAGTVTDPASGSTIELEFVFDEQGLVK